MTGSLAAGGRADADGAIATIGGASADAAASAVVGGACSTASAEGVDDDNVGVKTLDDIAVDALGVPLALTPDFALDLPRPLSGTMFGTGIPPGSTAVRCRRLRS